jgi:hypothetical protein
MRAARRRQRLARLTGSAGVPPAWLMRSITRNTIQPMNTAAKLLEAMHHQPLDWRIEQLQTVARQHGID